MIELREATFDDTPQVRELAIRVYDDTFAADNTVENMQAFFDEAYNLEKLQKEFYEPTSRLYLACAGDTIVAFMRLRETDEVKHLLGDNTLELHRLYIDKAYQGQQVGRMLMEKALDYARERSVEWIWLGVWERNFRAQKFYARWGFERFSEHVFQMGDDPQVDWLLKRKMK